MRLKYSSLLFSLPFLLFAYFIPVSILNAGPVDIRVNNMRFSSNVKSFHELRWNKLTRQGWDMSCGAATLSTLLTYHSGRPFSEMAITLTILKNSDPALVRKRGGFSLFDLKRFVRAIGLDGLGYGAMTLDDLESFNLPAILPIRIKDFDHFVLFRKRLGDHVLLGDPAFGNISLASESFLKMWKSKIAFYVVTAEEKNMMDRQERNTGRSPLSPDVMDMPIPSADYAQRLLNRIPIVPITRRTKVHFP